MFRNAVTELVLILREYKRHLITKISLQGLFSGLILGHQAWPALIVCPSHFMPFILNKWQLLGHDPFMV